MESPAKALRSAPKEEFQTTNFQADAALIAELGERLVGQAQIALAELIKNSYDADATQCQVTIGDDFIAVEDNGHGMTRTEFMEGWMRVGTQRKRTREGRSPGGRRLTGSKGIGRLSAQFLGGRLYLQTKTNGKREGIECRIDWDDIATKGDLTKAPAEYRTHSIKHKFLGSASGTLIVIEGLKHKWSRSRIEDLAREIWVLRPPLKPGDGDSKGEDFQVALKAERQAFERAFESQMTAALDNWQAKITGKVRNGRSSPVVDLTAQLARPGGHVTSENARVSLEEPGLVDTVDFDIRVFSHTGKQRHGVLVQDMREYFKKHGGVHLTDAGFRLPYYGLSHDWLGLEVIHSHRLSTTRLLPPELRVDKAMQAIPTQTRLFGVVAVDTAREEHTAKDAGEKEYLKIQVTRDRLADNEAFEQLKQFVLAGLEFYAACKTREDLQRKRKEVAQLHEPTANRFMAKLDQHREDVPKAIFEELRSEAKALSIANTAREETARIEKSMMASLATAGMAAIALEHELKRHTGELKWRISQIKRTDQKSSDIKKLIKELEDWINRTEETRQIVGSLLNLEDRTDRKLLRARRTIEQVVKSSRPLLRKIDVCTSEVHSNLRLPPGSYVEWQAVFQNVFINAVNALLDTEKPKIRVSSETTGERQTIYVEDNGVGIDLNEAERFFEPFERKQKISRKRRALGAGGSGLGLTIVRSLCETLNCSVGFVLPSESYNTAFMITWEVSRE
jgi:signal transduction histidine kinase